MLATSRVDKAHFGETDRDASIMRLSVIGLGLILLMVFGIGGWAAQSPLSSAVIAGGQLVADTSIKKIQHQAGGTVKAIHVKSGDHVAAGDLLVELDDTQTRASLDMIRSELAELLGRKARLAAERDGATYITFPTGFADKQLDGARVVKGERELFEARARSMRDQQGQLRERIGQFRNEIVGLTSQEKAKFEELRLVKEEHKRVETMYEQQLVPVTRLLQIERDETRISGEDGSLIAQIARSKGEISETELRIIELDTSRRADAQKELRELEERIGELNQRQVAAEDAVRHVELRAPQAGTINELSVHTVGGVIGPGEVVATLVPQDDVLVVEVRVATSDIDQLYVGEAAVLRFTAFNQRTTPEFKGAVSSVGSDALRDQQSGTSYYSARVKINDDEVNKLRSLKLVAGMPVEAFIQTGERTALSYLVKPFRDQLARVFREE